MRITWSLGSTEMSEALSPSNTLTSCSTAKRARPRYRKSATKRHKSGTFSRKLSVCGRQGSSCIAANPLRAEVNVEMTDHGEAPADLPNLRDPLTSSSSPCGASSGVGAGVGADEGGRGTCPRTQSPLVRDRQSPDLGPRGRGVGVGATEDRVGPVGSGPGD